MATVEETSAERSLRRAWESAGGAAVSAGGAPVLLLVEGAAGAGKTTYLRRLCAQAESAGVRAVRWWGGSDVLHPPGPGDGDGDKDRDEDEEGEGDGDGESGGLEAVRAAGAPGARGLPDAAEALRASGAFDGLRAPGGAGGAGGSRGQRRPEDRQYQDRQSRDRRPGERQSADRWPSDRQSSDRQLSDRDPRDPRDRQLSDRQLPDHRAAGAPVLLTVDDAHLAEPDLLERLRGVLARPAPRLVAVVLAYRPEELAEPGLPLGAPPPRTAPEFTVLRHRLEPWDEDRVRRAAEEVLGDRATAGAVRRLHQVSGGVAQVVVDLLAVLRESPRQTVTAAEVDAAGVPVRLAELILGRTAALPAPYRIVVGAAGVLDEPVRGDELLAVAGLSPVEGHLALLAALSGAALVARGEEGGQYAYGLPVPLAAGPVRESLPAPVREQLHARAAEVLVRRQPVPWAAVARHRRACGRVKGWLRAVERAATEATAAGRHPEAIALLERTLASAAVPPRARGRLAPMLSRSAVVGLRSDETVQVLTQIVQDEDLPAVVRGEVRLDLGLLLCNQVGLGVEGWGELERASDELREERPDLSARAMSALAMPYWPISSLATHKEWMDGAEEAAADSGDVAVRAAVAAGRASLAMSYGDPGAVDLLKTLPVDSTDPPCLQHAARGLCNAADSSVWLGHYSRAVDLLAEGQELAARSGAPYTEHTALGARLQLEWATGRWAGLTERCEAFVEATADMPVISADARMVLGLLALARGEWGRALSWLSGEQASPPGAAPAPLAAAVAGALIRLELVRENTAAAAGIARKAWAGIADKGVWVWAAELAPWAVEAVARDGDAAAARAMAEEFAAGLDGLDAPAATASLSWSRAALAEAAGALTEAAGHYRRAAAAYGKMPRPYAAALTAEGAARCVLAALPDGEGEPPGGGGGRRRQGGAPSGAPDRALAELDGCVAGFTELGAVWDAARARAALREHQPAEERRRAPGRPSYGDRLSPRESEVAELAASGLTNREIAGTLHLSHRTVEQHVARAMHKLGTVSRRDLAAASAADRGGQDGGGGGGGGRAGGGNGARGGGGARGDGTRGDGALGGTGTGTGTGTAAGDGAGAAGRGEH
ncbi:helix-turn-helix transcriptional regulator [Streptomyces sp. SCSIO ZS0520]|uniref:helix-turn-helix transcriptional regulator n=1 Tax=Streptomyces sp. SCSIO ZS0520 TaxID=2892996 RepID=UPI0021D946BC|nr:helix-turn-helix transcriptional regulator [Streptomyces sp. SCSIO ZS0520]